MCGFWLMFLCVVVDGTCGGILKGDVTIELKVGLCPQTSSSSPVFSATGYEANEQIVIMEIIPHKTIGKESVLY